MNNRIFLKPGLLVTFAIGVAAMSAQPLHAQSQPTGDSGKVSRQLWWVNTSHGWDQQADWLWRNTRPSLSPAVSDQLTLLDSTSAGDHYAQILRGYITAPVSGEYCFWISGDDHMELWLAENDDKFTRRRLSQVLGWTGYRDFAKYSVQRPVPVNLEAGKRYYIEARQSDWAGDDHVSVAWSYAGGAGLTNWAREAGVQVTQSSTYGAGIASRAVDGDLTGNEAHVTHTQNEAGAWWQADLGQTRQIDRIELYNRDGDGWAVMTRLSNYRISILDAAGNTVLSKDCHTAGSHTQATEYWETGGVQGNKIKVELLGSSPQNEQYLSLAEVRVLGREDTQATYQGIEVIPSSVLQSYAGHLDDADEDELRDGWETQHGFITTAAETGDKAASADPDRDGLNNLEESALGTAPFQGTSAPGMLTAERWNGISKYSVQELVATDAFHTQAAWLDAVATTSLAGTPNYCGVRLRGYITAPETGNYRFWTSSRGGSELWLSTDATKYRKRLLAAMGPEHGTAHGIVSWDANLWDQFSSQMSREVHLVAGQKYFLEVLNQNGHGGGHHASLAWARPGQSREALPLTVISSYALEAGDGDDDYLPDAWETQHGLSATDNGATDRVRQGERGDFDLDGLSNREEYVLGTNPANADTDGDGLSDGDEHRAYGTDPTQSDAPSEQLVGTLDLSAYTSTGLVWNMTGEGLIPASFRGGARWNFTTPASGHWSLNIATRLLGDLRHHEAVDVEILVDGTSLGSRTLAYGRDRDALLRVITPVIAAGTHTLEIRIDNMLARRMVSIRSISVMEPQGADLNGDGIPDWINSTLTGANTLASYQPLSRTSPAFLEGRTRLAGAATLNGAAVSTGQNAFHWYAGLPLQTTGTTPFTLAFESGVSETGAIQWQATNILDGETLIIRKGDSLKLTAQPASGTTGQPVTLGLPSATNWARQSGASATQSSTFGGCDASRAIDGSTAGGWAEGSLTHTDSASGSWWQLDLGQDRNITRIHLWNRTDAVQNRLSNYRISVLDSAGGTITSKDFHVASGHTHRKENWYLGAPVTGRKVKVELLGPNRNNDHYLSLAEVEVFGNAPHQLASDTGTVTHRFDMAGTHRVTASHAGGSTGSLTVHVRQADLSTAPLDLLSNTVGNLRLPALSVDSGLYFEGGDAFDIAQGATLAGDWFYLKASPRKRGTHNLLARLHPGGPILGTRPVNLIGISDALQNGLTTRFLSRDFTGYSVLTTPVVATGLPAGATVVIRIFRAGVTFTDGTTAKTLSASDFINGVAHVDFLFPVGMAGGYCHYLDIYDRNGAFLGRR